MGQVALGCAPTEYRPRSPEQSVLYKAVAGHIESFFTFSIDLKNCTQCGGKLELVAAIKEEATVEKILKHVGRPCKPPDIAPAQYPDQLPLF